MLKFVTTLSLVACAILVLGLWGMETLPAFFYQTLIFLFITTAGLFRFLYKTKQERPDYFVQLYLLTMVVKLVAYGVYLFIIVTSLPDRAVTDVVYFLGVYFVFTAIEIGFLYRHVNH